jgi:Na+-translocating ferredoxin:NAD+ oxidoreductase RnfG subunit
METIIPLPTELLLPVQCREGCSIHQTATALVAISAIAAVLVVSAVAIGSGRIALADTETITKTMHALIPIFFYQDMVAYNLERRMSINQRRGKEEQQKHYLYQYFHQHCVIQYVL